MRQHQTKQTAELLDSLIAASPADLDLVAEAAFGALGFDGFSLLHVADRYGALDPRSIRGRLFQEDWWARYARRGYARYDVTACMTLRSSQPFTWSEAEARFPSEKSRAYLADARRYSTPDALVCPVAGVDGDVRCVTLGLPAGTVLSGPDRALAHTLACLYAALAQRGQDSPPDWDLAEAQSLSRRELQCVYWVFHGKTDLEIAHILSISASTVHHHVEKAKTKLAAHSRVDLARCAIQRGIVITPRPFSQT